jgi:hypothetical protein
MAIEWRDFRLSSQYLSQVQRITTHIIRFEPRFLGRFEQRQISRKAQDPVAASMPQPSRKPSAESVKLLSTPIDNGTLSGAPARRESDRLLRPQRARLPPQCAPTLIAVNVMDVFNALSIHWQILPFSPFLIHQQTEMACGEAWQPHDNSKNANGNWPFCFEWPQQR